MPSGAKNQLGGRQSYRFTSRESRTADILPTTSRYRHRETADYTQHTHTLTHITTATRFPHYLLTLLGKQKSVIEKVQMSVCALKVKPLSFVSGHIMLIPRRQNSKRDPTLNPVSV